MSNRRQLFTITEEPRGQLYKAILVEAMRYCDRFSLVQRNDSILDPSVETLMSTLSPHLLEERVVTEWPGTKLLEGAAILREYKLTQISAAILRDSAGGLYDWCHPQRPEDLVLWRSSDGPWLVTIAHERDAYFQMTATEQSQLQQAIPALLIVSDAD